MFVTKSRMKMKHWSFLTFSPANFVNTGEIQENNKDWGGPRRQKQDAIFVNPAARGNLALLSCWSWACRLYSWLLFNEKVFGELLHKFLVQKLIQPIICLKYDTRHKCLILHSTYQEFQFIEAKNDIHKLIVTGFPNHLD